MIIRSVAPTGWKKRPWGWPEEVATIRQFDIKDPVSRVVLGTQGAKDVIRVVLQLYSCTRTRVCCVDVVVVGVWLRGGHARTCSSSVK